MPRHMILLSCTGPSPSPKPSVGSTEAPAMYTKSKIKVRPFSQKNLYNFLNVFSWSDNYNKITPEGYFGQIKNENQVI